MQNSWKCPLCGELIESVGPNTLELEKKGHNKLFHPLGDQSKEPDVYKWTCFQCGEEISRGSKDVLDLAKTGHIRFKHWREEEQFKQCSLDGTISIWGGATDYDRRMLEGMRIIW